MGGKMSLSSIYNIHILKLNIAECPLCFKNDFVTVFPSCKKHIFCKKCIVLWSDKCKEQYLLNLRKNSETNENPIITGNKYLNCPLCRN